MECSKGRGKIVQFSHLFIFPKYIGLIFGTYSVINAFFELSHYRELHENKD